MRASATLRTALLAFLLLTSPAAASDATCDDRLAARGRADANSCRICHAFAEGKHSRGPNLFRLIGRPIAGVASYDYSAALIDFAAANEGRVWDDDLLEDFLADASATIPGIRAKLHRRIASENRRKALACWLERNAR